VYSDYSVVKIHLIMSAVPDTKHTLRQHGHAEISKGMIFPEHSFANHSLAEIKTPAGSTTQSLPLGEMIQS
jgi:hypothetical protein